MAACGRRLMERTIWKIKQWWILFPFHFLHCQIPWDPKKPSAILTHSLYSKYFVVTIWHWVDSQVPYKNKMYRQNCKCIYIQNWKRALWVWGSNWLLPPHHIMMFRWITTQPYKNGKALKFMLSLTIMSMTIYNWILPLNNAQFSWFILAIQSMGEMSMKNPKTCISLLLEALVILMCNFFGALSLHFITDKDCMESKQLFRFWNGNIVKQCL